MVQTSDLESFVNFARDRLHQADSLAQLLDKWEAQREHDEVTADIRQGIEDAEAGRGRPADEVIEQARKNIGLA